MHGLYLLWWVGERGLSPTVVAAIIAAGDAALFALEVPTGWVADRFGHRASLLAGSVVQFLGLLACWLGRGVPELILASLLIALGDALRSGADEALLYRTCAALDRREDFLRITARTHAAGLIALVSLTLFGGYIATTWSLTVGWMIEVALCAAGAGLLWMMVEPPPARNETPDAASQRQSRLRRSSTAAAISRQRRIIGAKICHADDRPAPAIRDDCAPDRLVRNR